MKKEYVLAVFLICFFIWVAMVDHAVLPTQEQLQLSPGMLDKRQLFIWKFTGSIVGVFVLLCGLAFINKPFTRR
jgi:hypothetical protein